MCPAFGLPKRIVYVLTRARLIVLGHGVLTASAGRPGLRTRGLTTSVSRLSYPPSVTRARGRRCRGGLSALSVTFCVLVVRPFRSLVHMWVPGHIMNRRE